jgi:dCMP deaminase
MTGHGDSREYFRQLKKLLLFVHGAKMNESHERPCWSEYFMSFAKLAATRSSCIRRQVGAVIVMGDQIIATGYNGPPQGLPHADVVGCLRDRLKVPSGERHELCRGLHAEQNAIIQAARHGVSLVGADMFCTLHPCSICLKMIINAGIRSVCYRGGYPDELAKQLLQEAQAANGGPEFGWYGK